MNIEKACSVCKETKSASEYSPDSRARDGLQSCCRACAQARRKASYHADKAEAQRKRREYYEKKKELVLASNAASRERNRDAVLQGKKDYYDRVKTDPEWQEKQRQLRARNKQAKKAYDEEYRAKNSEKAIKRAREWARRNPEKRSAIGKAYSARRRACEKGGDPTSVILAWEQGAKKICYWCGKNCRDDYHVDHYEPLSKGGRHEVSNLVIACPSCNLKKNAKDPFQFAQSVGRLF